MVIVGRPKASLYSDRCRPASKIDLCNAQVSCEVSSMTLQSPSACCLAQALRSMPHRPVSHSAGSYGGMRKGSAAVCTVELALELGQDEGHRLSSAGGGGHDVERCGTCTPQVPVGRVQQPLVACVAVCCGHGALHNAKLLVQHLLRQRPCEQPCCGVVATVTMQLCWAGSGRQHTPVYTHICLCCQD